jgi:uncharacterized protein with beta-barrel porin domain
VSSPVADSGDSRRIELRGTIAVIDCLYHAPKIAGLVETLPRRLVLRSEVLLRKYRRAIVEGFVVGGIMLAGAPISSQAATFTVSTAADAGAGTLRQAINDLNLAGAGTHSIVFDSGLVAVGLVSDLPPILGSGQSITITGSNNVVDGASQAAIFFVGGGNVTINDLVLTNGQAGGGKGGDSQAGGAGGGGLGAGGALFVNGGAAVTISNVTFAGNEAVGGAGGGVPNFAAYGGGGGGGFRRGSGGDSGYSGAGGGGGFAGNGGAGEQSGNFGFGRAAGGGGGGLIANGANGSGITGGAGGGTQGGDGGNILVDGDDGLAYGGGGGGGAGGFGGDAGDFGGGGGGGAISAHAGGSGGFGGGGGGGAETSGGGSSGFGGGSAGSGGGGVYTGGNGGDALGGAIFVREGGTLTIINSGIAGSEVTGGAGGSGLTALGADGSASGAGVYLHTGVVVQVDVSSGSTSWADQISGAGGLAKIGNGALVLNAANNYTGVTSVDDGRLVVNGAVDSDVIVGANGAVGGNGILENQLLNQGIVAPGNSIGTLSVGGNYTQAANGVLEIEINDGGNAPGANADLLAVTGTAHLDGVVTVAGGNGSYTAGTQYTFLTASSINGGFSGIADDLAFYDAILGYTSTSAFFRLALSNPYVDAATTVNTYNVGTYLDVAAVGATGEFAVLLNELNQVASDDAEFALEQLTGAVYGSTAQTGIQNASIYVQTLANRLRTGIEADDSIAGNSLRRPTVLVSSNGERPLLIRCDDGAPLWNTWATGFGLGGDVQSDGNAAGLNSSMGGTLVGGELLDDARRLGFYGGYIGSRVSTDVNETSAVNGGTFGAYVSEHDDAHYYIASTGVAFSGYESAREIAFADATAHGETEGWQGYGYLERGLALDFHRMTMRPFGAMQYIYLRQNDFTEFGGGGANLNVSGIDAHSLRSVLGGRLAPAQSRHNLRPEIRALWFHELLDISSDFQAYFAPVGPGQTFAVNGLGLGRDWAMLGGGASCSLGRGWSAYGGYDLMLNERQTFHVGSGQHDVVERGGPVWSHLGLAMTAARGGRARLNIGSYCLCQCLTSLIDDAPGKS